MSRDLHPDTAAALEDPTLYPAWVVRLDIKDDPLEVWTGLADYTPSGTGDASLEGRTYDGVGLIGSISAIIDSSDGSQAVSLTLPSVDLEGDALKQFVWDARVWQYRQAWLWLALMNAAGQIVGRPIRFKTGRLDRVYARATEGSGELVVDIESHQAYASEALTSRYSEQRDIDSSDTSQDFVHDLANRQPNLGQAGGVPTSPGSGGGGAGGGRGGSGGADSGARLTDSIQAY